MSATWQGTQAERQEAVSRQAFAMNKVLRESDCKITIDVHNWPGTLALAEAIVPPMPEPEVPSVVTESGTIIRYMPSNNSNPRWIAGQRKHYMVQELFQFLAHDTHYMEDSVARDILALKYPQPTYRQVGWGVFDRNSGWTYTVLACPNRSLAEAERMADSRTRRPDGGTKRALFVREDA